jgi:hypothetical protein
MASRKTENWPPLTAWRVYLDHLVAGSGNEVEDYLVVEGIDHRPHSTRLKGFEVLPVPATRFRLCTYRYRGLGRNLGGLTGICRRARDAQGSGGERGLRRVLRDLVTVNTYPPDRVLSRRAARSFKAALRRRATTANDEPRPIWPLRGKKVAQLIESVKLPGP